jgi:hypothetical protein
MEECLDNEIKYQKLKFNDKDLFGGLKDESAMIDSKKACEWVRSKNLSIEDTSDCETIANGIIINLDST